MIPGDELSFLFFSFNILSKHISTTSTATAVNRSLETRHGPIIVPSEIQQGDVQVIHDPRIQCNGALCSKTDLKIAIAQKTQCTSKDKNKDKDHSR